jgi:hypothetical protein
MKNQAIVKSAAFTESERSRKIIQGHLSAQNIASGGPESVLPRWQGTAREKILQLPAVSVMPRMSMFELRKVSGKVDEIKNFMKTYSIQRFQEIRK